MADSFLSSPASDTTQEASAAGITPNQVDITSPSPQEPAAPPVQKPDDAGKTEQDAAREVAEKAGLDYSAIVSEYNTSGGISEDTRSKTVEAVTKLGLPAEVVDRYFENLDAKSQLLEMKAYKLTEGEEGYKAMADWARTNLTQEERTVYSELVAAGEEKQALTAVSMLYQQYKKSSGLGGTRIKASSGGDPGGPLFRSQQELAAAQADPAVAKSPTKQREIRDRLMRSIEAGVYQG